MPQRSALPLEHMPQANHLATYLEVSARAAPERTAIVGARDERLTYGQLDEQANRVAGFLLARGVQPGDRVGVFLPKRPETIAIIFGVMKAGAAYVPGDPRLPAARNRSILADCGICVLFTDARSLTALKAGAPGELRFTVVLVSDEAEAADHRDEASRAAAHTYLFSDVLVHEPANARPSRSASDLAYILYTSGSTGTPKGVMLTHDNAVSFVEWSAHSLSLGPDDRFASHAPLHFDLSIFDLYAAIRSGAEVHLISDDLSRDPRRMARFIYDRHLTIWYSAPSALRLMVEYGDLHRLPACPLRLILFAGEVFPVKHLRRLVELWPEPDYYNLYGPTETNVCTFAPIPKPIPAERTEPFPIGEACAHCAALVLDEDGQPVEPGNEGLLHIAGPAVFPGYWNRPDENRRCFREQDGRRWYNTGDVVRAEPGLGFVFIGRRDRMVKRRGYRIELGEIECALYLHEQIREAAVLAKSDPDGVRVVAFLASHSEQRPSTVELKQFCVNRLPAYMCPDHFVFLDTLPRTSTDKVDYQALARATQAAG